MCPLQHTGTHDDEDDDDGARAGAHVCLQIPIECARISRIHTQMYISTPRGAKHLTRPRQRKNPGENTRNTQRASTDGEKRIACGKTHTHFTFAPIMASQHAQSIVFTSELCCLRERARAQHKCDHQVMSLLLAGTLSTFLQGSGRGTRMRFEGRRGRERYLDFAQDKIYCHIQSPI